MRSSVITDTSPLQYLHQIGRLGLLADLYQRVIVPHAVAAELREGMLHGCDVPDVTQLPWATVEGTPAVPDARVAVGLGSGERDVLCWALQAPESLVILDDAEARTHAKQLGIRFTGTLGVLVKARQTNRVPALRPLLDHLQQAGFFLTDSVRAQILAIVGESP